MKKRILCLFAIIFTLFLLISCNKARPQKHQSEKEENPLVIFYEKDAMVCVSSFQKRYPDYDAKYIVFDAYEGIEKAIEKYGEPDVILAAYTGQMQMEEWYKENKILNLNDFIEEDDKLDETLYFPETFDTGKVNDELIAIPLTVGIPLYIVRDEYWNGSAFEALSVKYNGRDLFEALNEEVQRKQDKEVFFFIHTIDIGSILRNLGILPLKDSYALEDHEDFIEELYQLAKGVSENYHTAYDFYDVNYPAEFEIDIWSSAVNPERFQGKHVVSEYIGAPQIMVSYFIGVNQAIFKQEAHILWIPTVDDENAYMAVGKTWGLIGAHTSQKERAYDLIRKMMDVPLDEELMKAENTSSSVNKQVALMQLQENSQKTEEVQVYSEKGTHMYSFVKEKLSEKMYNEVAEVLENICGIYRETELDIELSILQNQYIEEYKASTYENYYHDLIRMMEK